MDRIGHMGNQWIHIVMSILLSIVLFLSTALAQENDKPPTSIQLRSSYKTISPAEMKSLTKERGFYDVAWNPEGKFPHKYKEKIIHGDKVIVDFVTELMWHQSGSPSEMNYDEAMKWMLDFNNHGYAGYHDWRLPTAEEAQSLMENSKKNGDLYIDPLFSGVQRWIWTGDTPGEGGSWAASFWSTGMYPNLKGDHLSVRPVRSNK